uniref:Uncharacterized protein n=1 Tax=Arundo donax TaxID=35708 RepID=A0A0A9AYP9_ARUDO
MSLHEVTHDIGSVAHER